MATIPESHRDLLEAQVGVLATIGPDGFPQLSNVWFIGDEHGIKISLNTSRQKTKNILRNPKVSFLIADTPPYRYVEIRGAATVDDDDDYQFASKINEKYNAEVRDNDGPGDRRVEITIKPSHVTFFGGGH
jgi:PPOX class probable F420-dependent enzyme